jgi:hypothetical protein
MRKSSVRLTRSGERGANCAAGDEWRGGEHTIAAEMAEVDCKGLHRIEVRDRHGEVTQAVLELRFRRIPRGRDTIDWKLITNLPVTSRAEAIEKLQWDALLWKIEIVHKILKSGCQAERSKLRTAERFVNLLAMFCILSWRIFWLTMLNRSTRQAKAAIAFTPLEIKLLNRLAPERQHPGSDRPPSLQSCLLQLARLGGYLNRAGDAPPGNTVIWRGMSRLTDIEIGFQMGAQDVGD